MNRLANGLNLGLGLGSAPPCHLPSPGCRQPLPAFSCPAAVRDPASHPDGRSSLFSSCPGGKMQTVEGVDVNLPRQSGPHASEPSGLGGREGIEHGTGGRLSAAGPVCGAWLHPVWGLQTTLAWSCNPARTEGLLLLHVISSPAELKLR